MDLSHTVVDDNNTKARKKHRFEHSFCKITARKIDNPATPRQKRADSFAKAPTLVLPKRRPQNACLELVLVAGWPPEQLRSMKYLEVGD